MITDGSTTVASVNQMKRFIYSSNLLRRIIAIGLFDTVTGPQGFNLGGKESCSELTAEARFNYVLPEKR